MNTPFGGAKKWRKAYFIGIGGIGMSAIARFFFEHGAEVSGYDRTESGLTRDLEKMGMKIHYEDRPDLVPADADLVIYTPAIPADLKELVLCREMKMKLLKRSAVLEEITESSFNVCIAGTHGKTTITTMTAHLLRDTGFGCNAFLGGIAVNYNSNYWSSEKNVCVVEADEYDRSFLKLRPDIAVITAMDADHLDIYGTAASMEQAFIDFSNQVRDGGLLVTHASLKRGKELGSGNVKRLTYSLENTNADVYAVDLKMENGAYEFDVQMPGRKLEKVKLNMGGLHNIENALAAITVASSLDIDDNRIRSAVENFKGVKRRFEYVLRKEDTVFIDDYAHHPEELRALIRGAKGLFSDKKLTLIFQPHLYSRTRDLADGFAEVLDQADEVILLPIYPARELPIEGVGSEMIKQRMKNPNVSVKTKEDIMEMAKNWKEKKEGKMLITAGAGDIDLLVEPIKNIIQ
jgi:UDP-N-acetylmuramate--alanine ligase